MYTVTGFQILPICLKKNDISAKRQICASECSAGESWDDYIPANVVLSNVAILSRQSAKPNVRECSTDK